MDHIFYTKFQVDRCSPKINLCLQRNSIDLCESKICNIFADIKTCYVELMFFLINNISLNCKVMCFLRARELFLLKWHYPCLILLWENFDGLILSCIQAMIDLPNLFDRKIKFTDQSPVTTPFPIHFLKSSWYFHKQLSWWKDNF